MSTIPDELTVRQVNTADDAELAAVDAVFREAELAVLPDASLPSLAQLVTAMRRPSPEQYMLGFVAVDGESAAADASHPDRPIVGAGMVSGRLLDHTGEAAVQVWVPPRYAGRGIGHALADACESAAAASRRHTTLAEVVLDGNGSDRHRRFAEARGYRLGLAEVERRCRLPIAESTLTACSDEAAAHHPGYVVRAFTGPVPAEWAAGYCAVHNRLSKEAPTGDLAAEESRRTPETLANRDEEIIAAGKTRIGAFAFDPDGQVVAFCDCYASNDVPELSQGGTYVHPDHRGHRLGLAVKAACYRLAQREFPDKDYITTCNAEVNDHMVAINDRLGFSVHSRIGTFQRRPDG